MPATTAAGPLGAEFEGLYRAHFAFVWRTLLHFGTPEAQVEDAVQDVFIVMHRRYADWDRAISARSWLYGIARRVASDHRRARARHVRKLEAFTPPPAPALEQRVEVREAFGILELALAELDEQSRDTFVMAELEGMSSREIADAIGANPNTVYSRLRKARAEVARVLARREKPRSKGRRHG